jgi:hypothetical protein
MASAVANQEEEEFEHEVAGPMPIQKLEVITHVYDQLNIL